MEPAVDKARKASMASVKCRLLQHQPVKKNHADDSAPKGGTSDMLLVHISDTHDVNYATNTIPRGDILIHSGDFTNAGDQTPDLVKHFVKWFLRQPHRYKILVCGNHELGLDRKSKEDLRAYLQCDGPEEAVRNAFSNPVLLNDESVTLNGIKFYGSSWNHCSMAWSAADWQQRKQIWTMIPADTDVLITHQPPLGQLDMAWQAGAPSIKCDICQKKHTKNYCHWGCGPLLEAVQARGIPLHLFGHVHDCHGFSSLTYTTTTTGGGNAATPPPPATTTATTVFSNGAMDIHKVPNLITFSKLIPSSSGKVFSPTAQGEQQQEAVKQQQPIPKQPAEGYTPPYHQGGTHLFMPEAHKAPFHLVIAGPGAHPLAGQVVDVDSHSPGKSSLIAWKPLSGEWLNQVWMAGLGFSEGETFLSTLISGDRTSPGDPVRFLAVNDKARKVECRPHCGGYAYLFTFSWKNGTPHFTLAVQRQEEGSVVGGAKLTQLGYISVTYGGVFRVVETEDEATLFSAKPIHAKVLPLQ